MKQISSTDCQASTSCDELAREVIRAGCKSGDERAQIWNAATGRRFGSALTSQRAGKRQRVTAVHKW